jgi:hypothetical protein
MVGEQHPEFLLQATICYDTGHRPSAATNIIGLAFVCCNTGHGLAEILLQATICCDAGHRPSAEYVLQAII